MTILLDSGTTTFEIAKLLKHHDNLTVVTNDIKIAAELMNSNLTTIVVGGKLQNGVGALYGSLTEATLREMNVDLFFLGAHAIHPFIGCNNAYIRKSCFEKSND